MRLIDADARKKDWSMANKCEECLQDARKCQYEQNFTRMDICEMLDEAPTVGGWISTKDRLPDQYGEYLAVVSGEVMEVTFCQPIRYYKDGRKWSTCNADGFEWLNDGDVTYWMPLPEPPMEG